MRETSQQDGLAEDATDHIKSGVFTGRKKARKWGYWKTQEVKAWTGGVRFQAASNRTEFPALKTTPINGRYFRGSRLATLHKNEQNALWGRSVDQDSRMVRLCVLGNAAAPQGADPPSAPPREPQLSPHEEHASRTWAPWMAAGYIRPGNRSPFTSAEWGPDWEIPITGTVFWLLTVIGDSYAKPRGTAEHVQRIWGQSLHDTQLDEMGNSPDGAAGMRTEWVPSCQLQLHLKTFGNCTYKYEKRNSQAAEWASWAWRWVNRHHGQGLTFRQASTGLHRSPLSCPHSHPIINQLTIFMLLPHSYHSKN